MDIPNTVGLSATTNAAELLTADQKVLYEKAESTVKNYLMAGKTFPLFAMAIDSEGRVMSFLPSNEFADQKNALVGILDELIPKARERKIRANVLVTPIHPDPGTNISFAVFDLEQRGTNRLVVMLPYQGMGSQTIFGEREFKHGAPPKLFQP